MEKKPPSCLAENLALIPLDEEASNETASVRHREPRPGDLCPRCERGRLDYDGLLNLSCPACGHSLGGCFT